jgi:hypothetical protein
VLNLTIAEDLIQPCWYEGSNCDNRYTRMYEITCLSIRRDLKSHCGEMPSASRSGGRSNSFVLVRSSSFSIHFPEEIEAVLLYFVCGTAWEKLEAVPAS